MNKKQLPPAASHTPTPWKARQWGHVISIGSDEIDGIAFVNPYDDQNKGVPPKQSKLDGDFIVKAVNAHEDLMAAVEFLWETLKSDAIEGYDKKADEIASAALKKGA